MRALASIALTVPNGLGSSRRNSAVPARALTLAFAWAGVGAAGFGAAMVPAGYSADQANHFTCTLSTHSSVCPASSPATQRPAKSQNDFVSASWNRPAASFAARPSVTVRVGTVGDVGSGDTPVASGAGPLNLRGGEASGRYAEAVRVVGSQRTASGAPPRSSARNPALASASIG